jgi:hypothetical protein
VDISLIPLGKASASVATFVINNIAEVRLDCVVFVSPQDVTTGDILLGTSTNAVTDIVAYRNSLPSTSYAVMDSGPFKLLADVELTRPIVFNPGIAHSVDPNINLGQRISFTIGFKNPPDHWLQ